jgi:hypothetical protein
MANRRLPSLEMGYCGKDKSFRERHILREAVRPYVNGKGYNEQESWCEVELRIFIYQCFLLRDRVFLMCKIRSFLNPESQSSLYELIHK